MKTKASLICVSFVFLLCGCTSEYDCKDPNFQLNFIGYNLSEIDTLVYTKFQPGNNFTQPIDTFLIQPSHAFYIVKHDTIRVDEREDDKGLKPGYDWQIFIPATNKTIFLSNIMSSHEKGKMQHGLFSMDHLNYGCENTIFSAKQDNQSLTFNQADSSRYFLYIKR